MKTRSVLAAALLAWVLSLMVISAWPSSSGSGKKPLVLWAADAHARDYPTVRALQFMATYLDETSGGRIQLKIFAGGQLGKEQDTILANRIGAIHLNRVNLSLYNNIEAKTTIPALPYIFRSQQHLHRVMDGAIGQEILDALQPHGLVGLAFYDSGCRSFYTTRGPIRRPEDLRGLKIRVQNTDVFVEMIRALGASPTPMGFGEVYEALATGVIDGAENNFPSFVSTRHFEIAQHYSLDRHTMTPEVLTMAKSTWDRLDEDDRRLITAASQASVAFQRTEWRDAVEKARHSVLSVQEDVDTDAFVRAMAPVYRRFANTDTLRSLVRRIQEVEEA